MLARALVLVACTLAAALPAAAQDGILIAKSECRLFYAAGGELIKEYQCATGRGMCSPVGSFTIEYKCHNGGWSYVNGDWVHVGGANIPALGAFWMGLTARSGRGTPYGIHGTTQPQLIGQLVSAGCIRMRNREVDELYGMVPMGTSVTLVNYLSEGQSWLGRLTKRQLAYASDAAGSYDIYSVGSDGQGVDRLTNLPGDERTPVYSPDAEWVAFVHHGPDGRRLAIVGASGGKPRFLDGVDAEACLGWTAEGIIVRDDAGGVWRCDAETGEADEAEWSLGPQVTRDGAAIQMSRGALISASAIRPQLTGKPDLRDPAVAADGRAVAFSCREGSGRAIFVCRADGALMRRVVSATADAVEPAWSPRLIHGPGVTILAVETDPPGLQVLVRPPGSNTAYPKGAAPVEFALSSATEASRPYEIIARTSRGDEARQEITIARGQRKTVRIEVRRHGAFVSAVRQFLTGRADARDEVPTS